MSTGDLYRELIEMTGKLGFVDKSPAYSLSALTLERLDKTFKNAKFIHLVRHQLGRIIHGKTSSGFHVIKTEVKSRKIQTGTERNPPTCKRSDFHSEY